VLMRLENLDVVNDLPEDKVLDTSFDVDVFFAR
jgi:hypothetical protein